MALLTRCNKILTCNIEISDQFKELPNCFDQCSTFENLTLGIDNGHVVDQNANLYGWGNNINGELGTGDSFPRENLTEVRIFNKNKQYMRCIRTFSGGSQVVALFESMESPNGINVE